MTQELDLSTIFGEITKTLVANQQVLNEADKTNHNHGDNMVQTFKTAQKAVATGKEKSPSQQLQYAASRLQKTAMSGSGQTYAEGFARAAQKFEGKSVSPDNIGTLIEALMGSGQSSQPQQQTKPKPRPSKPKPQQSQGEGDMLSTLLGGLMSGEQQPQQSQPQPQQSQGGGDLLTTLLGSLMAGEQQPQQQQSLPQQSQAGGDMLTTLLGSLMGGEQQTQPQQSAPQQSQGGGDLLTTLLGGLMGGEQAAQPPQQSQPAPQQAGGDLMETLLGGLMGGSGSSSQQSQNSSGDLIGSLLGSMIGGGNSNLTNQSSGIDTGELLSAALKYFAAKQQGGSNLQAIMSALSKSSPLGSSPERTQSGALVIQTLINLLGKAQ